MKVRIGSVMYDSEKEPIAIFLSEQDKKNIADMNSEANTFCSYPKYISEEIIKTWLNKEYSDARL